MRGNETHPALPHSARLADFHLQAQVLCAEQVKADLRLPRGQEAFLKLDPGCGALSLVPGPQVTRLTPRYLVSHLAHKRGSINSNDYYALCLPFSCHGFQLKGHGSYFDFGFEFLLLVLQCSGRTEILSCPEFQA